MRVTADDGDKGILTMGVFHGANDVRRASAGRQPHQHIAVAEVQVLQIHRPLRFVVFHVFHGAENRFMSAGDDPHHLLRAGAEGRWAFTGIEDPQTP